MLDQNAYVIGGQGLHGIDLTSFTKRWVVPGTFEGIPAVDRDTVFAINQGVLEAFDVSTGESKGVYATGEPVFGQPIVTDDSIVVASSKTTYVFDRMTREAIATLPVGGRIGIANNLLLISGGDELSVYAINPQSPWQYRHGVVQVERSGRCDSRYALTNVPSPAELDAVHRESRPSCRNPLSKGIRVQKKDRTNLVPNIHVLRNGW